MKYICRERNSEENIIIESPKALNFLYGNLFGRILLKPLITKKTSNIVALYMNSSLSKIKIKKFIKKNNIDITEYEQTKYKSYNDFFTRKILKDKRPINEKKEILISPCDSKLSVYKINEDLTLNIKDSFYSIDTLINSNIINEYKDGYAFVFRLATNDYHRYCYIDDGNQDENHYIKGSFHTVQPISLKSYNFYKTNSRQWTILNTSNFGKVIQCEIGALCIGRIKNEHENYEFKKGEEKGYFEFGGSTIVLLFKKNTITIDEDILENSNKNIETIVKYGQKIGKAKLITRLLNKILD